MLVKMRSILAAPVLDKAGRQKGNLAAQPGDLIELPPQKANELIKAGAAVKVAKQAAAQPAAAQEEAADGSDEGAGGGRGGADD